MRKRNLKTQLTNSPQPPFSALEKKEGEKNEDIETMSMNNQHPWTQIELEMSGERSRGMTFRDVEGIYNAQFREKVICMYVKGEA